MTRRLISWIRGIVTRDSAPRVAERRLQVEIPEADRRHLEALARAADTPRIIVDRARILLSLAEGKPAKQISAEVGVSPAAVYRWSERYRHSGVAGLQDWSSSERSRPRSTKVRQMIRKEAEKLRRQNRRSSTSESPLRHWIDRACKERHYSDERLIEFVVSYLEVDPWYLWSGYIKEKMLTRLKRSALRKRFQERLRQVLADAVDRRGSREFKHYCRLAIVIADDALIEDLAAAASCADRGRCGRATAMLRRVRHHRAAGGAARVGRPASALSR